MNADLVQIRLKLGRLIYHFGFYKTKKNTFRNAANEQVYCEGLMCTVLPVRIERQTYSTNRLVNYIYSHVGLKEPGYDEATMAKMDYHWKT